MQQLLSSRGTNSNNKKISPEKGENMDPELHNAATQGIHHFFDEISTNREETEEGSEAPNEHYFIENYYVERTPEGDNILHVAARQGHEQFIAAALQKVPVSVLMICQKNNTGENPLHVAAESGHLGVARLLVGAYKHYQQDVEGAKGKSSLLSLTVAEEGVAAEPWRATDPSGQTPLHKALKAGREQLAIYLLEEDPVLACFDSFRDESPLYLAAVFGHQTIAEKILMSSTPYSLNGPGGATPLHVAVYSAYTAAAENIVRLVLQKHPELIRKADSNKDTPLHHAAKTEQVGIVEMIVRADNSLDVQNVNGTTALPVAERSSANQRDADGLTPLLKAATMDLVQVVITLLRYSPKSIAICDKKGKTVLHLIKLKSYHEGSALFRFPIIKRLVNEPDHDGNTPLHLAMKRQDHFMANILLDTEDIKPNVKNRNALTPRDLMKSQEELSDDMVEIGYQLIMQERQGQRNPEPETNRGATLAEEIPERSPEAIQERTPIVVRTQILEDASNSLQYSFNTLSVISSILAAVTFAAIIATPGGFSSNGGLRLESKVLFKVFMVSNASAMSGYMLVLFCVLWATRITQQGDEPRLLLSFSIYLLQLSFYATLAAFATASYALISAKTFWLAVVLVSIPGCVIILTLPKFLLLRLAKMLLRFHV